MNRIERLTGILLSLQGGPRSASQLAGRFEVSRRTIMRDIDALGEIGVPVVALPGRAGGYRIAEGYWLSPLQISAEEATALLFALNTVGDPDTSPLGEAHRAVVDKIQAILNADVRTTVARNLSSLRVAREQPAPHATVIAALRTAMAQHSWCAIDYRSPKAQTTRTILPTEVYTASDRWYVSAIDSLRRAMRIFRIDRITAICSSIAPDGAEAIIAEVAASQHHYGHPDHPEVHALLTSRGVQFAMDHPDFREAVIDKGDGGELRFRCPPGELPYYGREFFRLGTDIRVVAPPELQQWMADSLAELLSHVMSSATSPATGEPAPYVIPREHSDEGSPGGSAPR